MSDENESIYGSCGSESPANEEQTIESNIKSTSFLIGEQAKHIDEQLSKIENDTIQSYKSNINLASNKPTLTNQIQTEALIDKWISMVKNRYKSIFEVDENDVRSLVIQVIKLSFADCQAQVGLNKLYFFRSLKNHNASYIKIFKSDNPESVVDNKMNDFLNEIAKPEQISKMMRRALDRFEKEKSDAPQKVINPEIIKQVDDLLIQLVKTESNDELEEKRRVLSKEQKCQLYELFLSEELSELNSLVFNRIDNEFASPSKSKISKEQLLPKDARFDTIKSIFNELNRAEERFGNTTHLSQ